MLIDDLRRATSEHHARAEAAFDLGEACRDSAAYASLLRTLLSIYGPLESRVDRLAGLEPSLDWPSRKRAALLRADLSALGLATAVDDHPAVDALPLDDADAVLGVLYVTEGSTLGGQVIRKHVAQALGFTAGSGCAFFTGYGPDTGRRWRDFVEFVNAAGDRRPQTTAKACAAAVETFEFFGDALATASARKRTA